MLVKADALRDYKDDVKYVVYPFLQKKGTMFFGAPPKHLKTLLALQMSYAIATGREFLSWATTKSGLLYIEQEIGLSITAERFERMRKHFGDNHVGMTFWAKDKLRLSLDVGTRGREELHAIIKDLQPTVVVFDPFRKMTGADENSSTEMTKVFQSMTELQETFDFASVLIHHTAKPSDQRKQCEPEALRGSSEIFAHGDTYGIFCNLKNDKEIDVHWTFRNHGPIDPFRIQYDETDGVFSRRQPPPSTTKKKESISDGLLEAK